MMGAPTLIAPTAELNHMKPNTLLSFKTNTSSFHPAKTWGGGVCVFIDNEGWSQQLQFLIACSMLPSQPSS